MRKISLYVEYHHDNKIFDINDKKVNRDNFAYSYYLLKKIFSENNFDLSTSDINDIKKSEAVIYNDMPKVLPSKNDISKSYLLIFESELIKPENWDLEKHKYFNKIFTWDDRYIDNKKYFKINFSHLFPKIINKDLRKKEKLCTLIAANKEVHHPLELYSHRVNAIKWFEKNHLDDFDFYGIGWDEYLISNRYLRFIYKKLRLSKFIKPNFKNYKGKIHSKKVILEKYKFAICYENARDIDGYITEKIFDCFFAGCIPIYWGANNITEHIPKECFIDKRDFETYEELYEYLNNMSDKTYSSYLNLIETYLQNPNSYIFDANYFANKIIETVINDIKKN